MQLVSGQSELRSGMNVDVTFIGERVSEALVVPTVAIVTRQGQTGVLVPDEQGKEQFRAVTVGLTQDGQTRVLKGLRQGERVFIDFPGGKAPSAFSNGNREQVQ